MHKCPYTVTNALLPNRQEKVQGFPIKVGGNNTEYAILLRVSTITIPFLKGLLLSDVVTGSCGSRSFQGSSILDSSFSLTRFDRRRPPLCYVWTGITRQNYMQPSTMILQAKGHTFIVQGYWDGTGIKLFELGWNDTHYANNYSKPGY